MGCKGSKHAHALVLHGAGCGGLPERPSPEPRRRSSGSGLHAPVPRRHSVALRSSTLGTLSLDRAAAAVAAAGLSFDAAGSAGTGGGVDGDEGMMKADNDVHGGGAGTKTMKLLGPSRSFGGWRPTTPPPPPKRQQKRVAAAARVLVVAPRTPSKTPVRGDPEEIDVWELMKGLDDDDEGEDTDDDDGGGVGDVDERKKARSAPGSPAPAVFDPEMLDAFRKALDGLTIPDDSSPLPDLVVKRNGSVPGGDVVEQREIQMFPGIVRARVEVFQEKINAKTKNRAANNPPPPPGPCSPPPESAGRVVVYVTSLRGIRQTYEDCAYTTAVLRSYGVLVDERDLSMHAAFKHELRAALAGGEGQGRLPLVLPQVFADGRHLGGAEEVRRMHERGELAAALGACDTEPCVGKGGGGAAGEACASCGGVRFVPCEGCSGSCKVFVEEEEEDGGGGAGAFRRCPECNENGLVRCSVC